MRFCWAVALGLALQGIARTARAQAPPPAPASDTKPYVLHVYANLIQVPVLALDPDYKSLRPLSKADIDVSLDSGPIFHPTQMHLEGEEPISLAILLDAGGSQDSLLRGFADSAETMANHSLRPHDHITLFAADCKIVRSALNLPVAPQTLRNAVATALADPVLHDGRKHSSCGHSVKLWDAAAIALKNLAQQPGRRMLLIVSDGEDHKSATPWVRLRLFASDNSIAVFGLSFPDAFQNPADFQRHLRDAAMFARQSDIESPFAELCGSTGGLILSSPTKQLSATLERLIAMLRGRYIVEFPRADNATSGRHSIDVTVPRAPAYIATAGVTVAMPNAGEKDPNTIPSAPSPAVMGKRAVLPTVPH